MEVVDFHAHVCSHFLVFCKHIFNQFNIIMCFVVTYKVFNQSDEAGPSRKLNISHVSCKIWVADELLDHQKSPLLVSQGSIQEKIYTTIGISLHFC